MRRRSGISHLSRTLRVLVALLAATVVSVGLQGTASGDTVTRSHTWTVRVGEQSRHQAIQGMAFLPSHIWIDAGDSVVWRARAAEIHTVTFLATGQSLPAFNPGDPAQLFPVGGPVYDGSSYYNSGILANVADSGFPAQSGYSLRFPTAGNYTYYCLVHGAMMKGVVHVRPAGTPYRYTQADYNHQAKRAVRATLRDGYALMRATKREARQPRMVIMGADDGTAMLMRFYRRTVIVHVGQRVTFMNNGMAEPHTVTFGPERANIFAPYGDPTHFTGGQLNSGIIGPHGTFTVTFKRAGTFRYICALHDYMGMVGKVIVRPRHDED
ncbi:MAG: plastocyanin/azurin family copper-binding protein [Nocardioidaceae bacterium]